MFVVAQVDVVEVVREGVGVVVVEVLGGVLSAGRSRSYFKKPVRYSCYRVVRQAKLPYLSQFRQPAQQCKRGAPLNSSHR